MLHTYGRGECCLFGATGWARRHGDEEAQEFAAGWRWQAIRELSSVQEVRRWNCCWSSSRRTLGAEEDVLRLAGDVDPTDLS